MAKRSCQKRFLIGQETKNEKNYEDFFMTVTPGYRLSHWEDRNDELEAALDAFWNVAYDRGQQPSYRDEQGTAQEAESNLRQIIANISQRRSSCASHEVSKKDLLQLAEQTWNEAFHEHENDANPIGVIFNAFQTLFSAKKT